jgi:transcriptional regulator with GAF, ATPase, and Fis domain
MNSASQHSVELDSGLLEIETWFKQRETRRALTALERLEKEGYSPQGINRGLHLLLLAQRAFTNHEYQQTISLCHEAFDEIGATSMNYRIGRLQYLMYRAHAALGDLKAAEQSARDSLASYRRVKDSEGIVNAYNALARIYYIWSDYGTAAEYVNEALLYSGSNPVEHAQLMGNLGRIYILTGDLDKAEANLRLALHVGAEHNLPKFIVNCHLSLGYLHLRRRQFHLAEMDFDTAATIITENAFRRERVILLEYQGELAFEKQDYVAAKTFLDQSLQAGMEIAPESTLISQSLRRLAEAQLELGRHDQAMRTAQKALDLSVRLGERIEIGLSHRAISAVFLARGEFADARRHGLEGIEIIREIGDQYELGKSIIAYGAIPPAGLNLSDRRILPLLQEAEKIFTLLGDDYHLAGCRFEMGRFLYFTGKNGDALEYLKESLKAYRSIGDRDGANRVNEFLHSLSQSAITRAMSDENEYKIFGNLISDSEYKYLKSGSIGYLLGVLIKRTGADRGFIVETVQGERPQISVAHNVDDSQFESAVEAFDELLGDRLDSDKPTLILDCTNEPDVSDLLPSEAGTVTSLIVLPLILGADVVGYIYLDRLSDNNGKGINPFTQSEIDFAVGFADLAAFKTADYQKEKLIEDNVRLKAQLLEQCVFPNIITQSRPFMETLARVRQVANSNMAVSITGETGTGKDLLAKAIHYNSNRRDKRFVSVNCAALPESLLESELFGYKKGAFTGADRDKPGLFEEADGGTFFLDEIADMPVSIQAKLLRVLEQQEITRLGDTKPRKVDVRVISATNKDLKAEMEDRRFRSDLYYRLCALNFKIPPLRERKEDIPLLVHHFLDGSKCQISPDAMKYLVDYEWPGNVRELENEVKKLILLANNDGIIAPSLLSSRIVGEDRSEFEVGSEAMSLSDKDGFSLYEYMAEFEKRFIIKALKEQQGIKKRAADWLNIPESTLRLKLKQYNIDPKRLDIN